jgi:MbtH protein
VNSNPFEDPDGSYYVLVNHENQHSLWPTFAEIPTGWEIAFGEADRDSCLDYVEHNWTDLRPRSLAEQMDGPAR